MLNQLASLLVAVASLVLLALKASAEFDTNPPILTSDPSVYNKIIVGR